RNLVAGIAAHVAHRRLERVHTAEACVLELRHFTMPRQPRIPERFEPAVDHAAHDHRTDRVVGARLGAEAEEPDQLRIDVVLPDQPQHGVRGHRVDVLVATRHAEAAADHHLDLVPGVARPLAPVLETYPKWGYVRAHCTDTRSRRLTHLRSPPRC